MQKKFLFALISVFSLLLFSCDKEDADDFNHEHFEPTKWVFELNGETYLEIDNGSITNNFNSEIVLNNIDSLTKFKIIFYDESGLKIDLHEDNSIAWKVEDEPIPKLSKLDEKGQEFCISAIQKGTTKITFYINHDDHSDITSPQINVVVN